MNVASTTVREPVSDVVVSLINHSNPDLLAACLRSLHDATRNVSFEVWVVDNATDQRGVAAMQAEFPRVRWLFNNNRLGFSANHNQVLAQARGRYYCILNDDIIVHKYALDELIAFMDCHMAIAVTGPRLLNIDGSYQSSAFRFPTLISSLIDICELPRVMAGYRTCSLYPKTKLAVSTDVDWLLGACLVVRNTILDKIGFLDERLSPVANGEDVDFCKRIVEAGWGVCYFPEATMTHYGGKSTNVQSTGGSDMMRVEMERVRIAYFKKHHGSWATAAMRVLGVIALPWNIGMLTQALFRGRLQGGASYFKRRIQTHIGIAMMCLGYRHFRHINPSPVVRANNVGDACA